MRDHSRSGRTGRPIIVLVHGAEDGPIEAGRWIWRRTGRKPDWFRGEDPELPRNWLERLTWRRRDFQQNPDSFLAGDRWWQLEGFAFGTLSEALRQAETGDAPVFAMFCWSGANDERERNLAASQLLALIARRAGEGDVVHIVAHGQGGNVARRAVQTASPALFARIRSVTSSVFLRYSPWPLLLDALVSLFLCGVAALMGLYWRYAGLSTSRRGPAGRCSCAPRPSRSSPGSFLSGLSPLPAPSRTSPPIGAPIFPPGWCCPGARL